VLASAPDHKGSDPLKAFNRVDLPEPAAANRPAGDTHTFVGVRQTHGGATAQACLQQQPPHGPTYGPLGHGLVYD